MICIENLYKEFIVYKILSLRTYINLVKKVKSIEDLKYTWGLVWFALTKIVFKQKVDNETVRGR